MTPIDKGIWTRNKLEELIIHLNNRKKLDNLDKRVNWLDTFIVSPQLYKSLNKDNECHIL